MNEADNATGEGAKRSEEKIERDEKERKDKEIAKDSIRGWVCCFSYSAKSHCLTYHRGDRPTASNVTCGRCNHPTIDLNRDPRACPFCWKIAVFPRHVDRAAMPGLISETLPNNHNPSWAPLCVGCNTWNDCRCVTSQSEDKRSALIIL
ncbi:hypothetical protein SNOG_05483 [Parastagonospora nodorum SN15]|uniref:Uncharacterized protein n=1 Tax=Phaeosphaeria nodorum (strain SN15 / ATCC MYA-4574 / FGSC 10173) TaxID=321614 RepID=Q0URY1_PHANO|nr:hypothetical protein SNOG_05483 [Parastagonospora nodorum SN15]EAT86547.2 hypothetical protein SNOG_05483 [Parastagonospora nodorum SN15]